MAASCNCVPVLLPSVEFVHLSVNLSVDAGLYQCAHVSMYHAVELACHTFLYISRLVRQLKLDV